MAQQIIGPIVRGLAKAAMKKKAKSIAKKPVVKVKPAAPKKPSTSRKAVKQRVAENKVDAASHYGFEWMNHPGAASLKSNMRLTKKGKWSTPSQIKKYQKQEAKGELKAEKRALKEANRPRRRRGK
jgi:hypothetical protein